MTIRDLVQTLVPRSLLINASLPSLPPVSLTLGAPSPALDFLLPSERPWDFDLFLLNLLQLNFPLLDSIPFRIHFSLFDNKYL